MDSGPEWLSGYWTGFLVATGLYLLISLAFEVL